LDEGGAAVPQFWILDFGRKKAQKAQKGARWRKSREAAMMNFGCWMLDVGF